MKRLIKNCLIVITGLLVLASVQAEIPPMNQNNQPVSIAPMLKRVMPSVVNIAVFGQLPQLSSILRGVPSKALPKSPKFKDVGSGVIINAQKGYIVTNAHVIRDAKTIIVTLNDGRRFLAKKIGADKGSDIAVLQIDADHLTALPLADSNKLTVGQFVAAIGSPFGLTKSVTTGVVSALNRANLGIEGYENFIQTDAPINPGNSGGALVDLQGKLVGINTAIIAPVRGSVGIGFAIPSNMVKSVIAQLIKHGNVKRGLLGVIIENINPDLADAFNLANTNGAIVTEVKPDSPAQKAGIKPEDVILAVDGEAVNGAAELRNTVGLHRVGSKIDLKIDRHGKILNLQATLASPKDLLKKMRTLPFLQGLGLKNTTEIVPTGQYMSGISVFQVNQASPGWLAGIRSGDIIVSANHEAVSNIEQLTDAISKNKNYLLIKVWRKQALVYLVIN